jgi:hypothetical protein
MLQFDRNSMIVKGLDVMAELGPENAFSIANTGEVS